MCWPKADPQSVGGGRDEADNEGDAADDRPFSATQPSRRESRSCPVWKRFVQWLNIDGDGQGDYIWKTERFERF